MSEGAAAAFDPTGGNPTGTGEVAPPAPHGHQAVPGSQASRRADSSSPSRGDSPSRGGGRGRGDGKRRRGGGGGRGERSMVPPAEFTSYYGRPVVKASPWAADIPAYLFLGGLAGGSSLLGAGADLTGRPALRRASRLTALGALGLSFAALVHDLGKPERFTNMLRVAKLTSPMSVGTWILSAYAPFVGLSAASEVVRMLPSGGSSGSGRSGKVGAALALVERSGRPMGVVGATIAPAVASYTAVLLADTATPSWHEGYREMPFVFVGSAAAASGGMGMVCAPVAEAGPARRMAVGGAVLDLVAAHRMEDSMGLTAEPLRQGRAGKWMRASQVLTAGGAVTAAVLGRRSRVASVIAGAALVAGSMCTRFGIFEAGQASAEDPRYTVVPQRERLDARP